MNSIFKKSLKRQLLIGLRAFVLIIFFGSSYALSQTDYAPETDLKEFYYSETKKVLKSLKDLNIKSISCSAVEGGSATGDVSAAGSEGVSIDAKNTDCLSIDDLAAELEMVKFKNLVNFKTFKTRSSLFYYPEEKTIFINTNEKHPVDLVGCLGLHELLGIMNRPEYEYQVSLPACILSKDYKKLSPMNFKFLASRIKNMKLITDSDYVGFETMNNYMISSGGVTIVGGGGDASAFKQRYLFYRYITGFSFFNNIEGVPFPSIETHTISGSDDVSELVWRDAFYYAPFDHVDFRSKSNLKVLINKSFIEQKPIFKNSGAPNRALEDLAFYMASFDPFLFPQFNIEFDAVFLYDGEVFYYPRFLDRVHPIAAKKLKQKYDRYCTKVLCEKISGF